jgi:hypothetical protein
LEIGGNLVNGNPECNTANLLARGYYGTIIDAREIVHPWFTQKTVTPENFYNLVREATSAPTVFSVDIDGNDYYILKAMPDEWRPKIVVVEYNADLPPKSKQVQPYNPDPPSWDGSNFFGASAGAMIDLMYEKGYSAVCSVASLNLVFVPTCSSVEPSNIYHQLRQVNRHPTDKSGRKYIQL